MDDPLYCVLKKVRERPDLYLNEKALWCLIYFIVGYERRSLELDINHRNFFSRIGSGVFSEFVKRHYFEKFKRSGGELIGAWPEEGFTEYDLFGSNKYWGQIISDSSSSEAEAFDEFYDRLEEYVQAGKPKPDSDYIPSGRLKSRRRDPIYGLLNGDMRKRPALHFGLKSLTKLYNFISGYLCRSLEIDPEYHDCFSGTEFDALVHRHYYGGEVPRTKKWLTLILENSGSEEEAFDTFYELFDEFLEAHKGELHVADFLEDDPLYSELKRILAPSNPYFRVKSFWSLIYFISGYRSRAFVMDPDYRDCFNGSGRPNEFNEFMERYYLQKLKRSEFKRSAGEMTGVLAADDFAEDVLLGASKSWGLMLADHSHSEAAAFDEFYERLDEFVHAAEHHSDSKAIPIPVSELEPGTNCHLYKILNGELRKRSALYFAGERKKLTHLDNFITGYLCRHGLESGTHYYDCFSGGKFEEFVRRRYYGDKTPKHVHWLKTILENSPSEAAAFDKFYELFDEFLEEHKDWQETE